MPSRQNYNANLQSSPTGEEQAFEFFFRQYYPTLCLFAYSIIKDEDEAKDIAQDCFIKLWDSHRVNERPEAIKSFLYTAVHNRCIDRLRNKRVIRKAKFAIAKDRDCDLEFFDELAFAETIRQLNEHIVGLTGQAQQIIKMYYLEGKKHHEIADKINSTPDAVRKQKVRALKALRGKLGFMFSWI